MDQWRTSNGLKFLTRNLVPLTMMQIKSKISIFLQSYCLVNKYLSSAQILSRYWPKLWGCFTPQCMLLRHKSVTKSEWTAKKTSSSVRRAYHRFKSMHRKHQLLTTPFGVIPKSVTNVEPHRKRTSKHLPQIPEGLLRAKHCIYYSSRLFRRRVSSSSGCLLCLCFYADFNHPTKSSLTARYPMLAL